MKTIIKLGLLIVFVLTVSCEQEYKDIEPQTIDGIALHIDSVKFEQALIRYDGDRLVVVDKEGIKNIRLIDLGNTAGLIMLFLIITFLIGVLVGSKG